MKKRKFGRPVKILITNIVIRMSSSLFDSFRYSLVYRLNLYFNISFVCIAAKPIGIILIDNDSDLETVRTHITRLLSEWEYTKYIGKWCFLDCMHNVV